MFKRLICIGLMFVSTVSLAQITRFDSGDGELFLVVRDHARKQSYVRGLDITMNQFIKQQNKGFVIQPDKVFKAWHKGWSGDKKVLYWAVLAGDSVRRGEKIDSPILLDSQRAISTVASGEVNIASLKAIEVSRMQVLDSLFLANVNSVIKDKKSAMFDKGNAAYFNEDLDNWGNWAPFSAMASMDDAPEFYILESATLKPTALAKVRKFPGRWSLSKDGVLSYVATVMKQAEATLN